MTYYYSCTLKHNVSYTNVLVETDKVFLQQFNKKHIDQYEELVDLAFIQLIKELRTYQICPVRSQLTLVYYDKLTKRDIELSVEMQKFENEVYLEWDKLYKASGIKMSTYSKTEGYFKNHILPYFGEMKVSKITVRHCEEFALKLSTELQYFHHVINYAKEVLEMSVRFGYIHTNPISKMNKYPKEKKHVMLDNYLETHELKKF